MIITKGFNQVIGYIEYSYDLKSSFFYEKPSEQEREFMFESDTFENLSELLEKVSAETIETIRESLDASKVWVSTIILRGRSEDGETGAELCLYENQNRGGVTTKIKNEDVDNRLLTNIQSLKKIIDNTLEEYPVKYS